MPLKTKIFIRSTMLSVSLILMVVAVHVIYVRNFHHRQIDEQYIREIAIRAAELERMMLWDDRVAVKALLVTVTSVDDCTAYAFVEREGRPFAHTFDKGVPRMLLGRAAPPDPLEWRFKDNSGKRFDDVSIQIGNTGAVLHIGHSVDEVYRDVMPLLAYIAAMGIVSMLVAVFFSRIIARRTIREVDLTTATLREREERLATTLNSIGDAVITTDLDGNILAMNPVAEKLTAWVLKDALGKLLTEVFNIVNARTRETAGNPVTRVLETGKIIGLANHTLLLAKDGSEYQIADSAAPIQDVTGETTGVVMVFRDVTKEYLIQESVRKSEVRFKQIAETIKDVFWITDLQNHKTLFASPAYERIWGRSLKDLYTDAQNWADAIHPEDRERAWKNFIKIGDGDSYDEEYRIIHPDGSIRWIRDQGFPVRNESGKVYRLAGIAQEITERKKSEEALQLERVQLLSIFNSIDQIIYISDPQTHEILFVNQEMKNLFQKDLVGGTCYKEFQGFDAPCEFCTNEIILEQKPEPHRWEYHNPELNRDYAIIDRIIKWSDGRDVRFELAIDITEHKRTEVALKESREHYQLLFNSAADAVTVLDNDGIVRECSKTVHTVYGRSEGEIIGRHITDFYDPESLSLHKDKFPRLMGGESQEGEIRIFQPDGTYVDVWRKATPLFDHQGRFEGVMAIDRDITDRKQADKDRMRLMSAVEHTEDSIVITDKDATIQYVNPAFENVTGYTREEVIGQNPRILKSGEHDDAFYARLWATLTRSETWRDRLVNKKKDGTFFTEEACISPVIDDGGNVSNFVAVKRDITDKLNYEEKLRQAQKMEAIGTLAGGIAHDFNNILFPIIGMSEMLIEDLPENSPERQNVMEILTAGKRGGDLVKQILAFSRQSEGKKIPVRIQKVLKDVIKMICSTIPANIAISHHFQPDCGLVMADPIQIHQIAMNLITNAYHAVDPDNGKISIQLEKAVLEPEALAGREIEAGTHVLLTVSDTGCGINPDDLDKIFEPYFTTKEQGKGTGIGLSTVYGIVKSHNGDIQVYSEPGTGTTFNVYLPLMVAALDPATVKPVEGYEPGTERILLVDDEHAIARLEKLMLERLGYQVTTRVNSLEALEAFKAQPNEFDLVITDMTMPNMTGDQLARGLISTRADIPVVICTGFSERMDPARAEAVGIKGFLMKPVVLSEMAQMVRRVLNESNQIVKPKRAQSKDHPDD